MDSSDGAEQMEGLEMASANGKKTEKRPTGKFIRGFKKLFWKFVKKPSNDDTATRDHDERMSLGKKIKTLLKKPFSKRKDVDEMRGSISTAQEPLKIAIGLDV